MTDVADHLLLLTVKIYTRELIHEETVIMVIVDIVAPRNVMIEAKAVVQLDNDAVSLRSSVMNLGRSVAAIRRLQTFRNKHAQLSNLYSVKTDSSRE